MSEYIAKGKKFYSKGKSLYDRGHSVYKKGKKHYDKRAKYKRRAETEYGKRKKQYGKYKKKFTDKQKQYNHQRKKYGKKYKKISKSVRDAYGKHKTQYDQLRKSGKYKKLHKKASQHISRARGQVGRIKGYLRGKNLEHKLISPVGRKFVGPQRTYMEQRTEHGMDKFNDNHKQTSHEVSDALQVFKPKTRKIGVGNLKRMNHDGYGLGWSSNGNAYDDVGFS